MLHQLTHLQIAANDPLFGAYVHRHRTICNVNDCVISWKRHPMLIKMCPTRANELSLLWKSSNHKFKRFNFPVQCKGSHIPSLSNYHVGSWTNMLSNFYYQISCSWIRKSCMFCMSPNILSVFHIQSYNLHCYSSERWITHLTLLPQVSIELILVSSGVFLNGVHIAVRIIPTDAWSMRMGTSLHKSR